jgi:hypothetical protein
MKNQKGYWVEIAKSDNLILIIFGFLVYSHLSFAQVIKNTSDLELKGKIKKVIIKEQLANEELGEIEPTELLSKNVYQFYVDGKIKSKNFTIDVGGKIDLTQNFSEDGYLISTYSSQEYTSNTIIDSFVYKSNKTIEKRIITVVDLNEKKVKENEYIERIFYYDYNDEGDMVSIKNKFLDEYGYDPVTFSCLLCYEKSRINLQILQSYVLYQMNHIDKIWDESINYPENEGETKITKKFSKDLVSMTQSSQEIKIKYFYDERKNWIKATVLLGTGNSPYIIKTRDISYY